MGKVRSDDSQTHDEIVDFKVERVTSAPADTFAVYDEGDGEWAIFPVVLFAVGTLTIKTGKQMEEIAGSVCGMVSNIGGLVMVEHAVDMKFIGYWRKMCQPFEEFLEDHEVEDVPSLDDEDDDGDE